MPVSDTLNMDFIANIAVQLPLLVLFIWYNDRMQKRFDTIQKERDTQFLQAIEKVTSHVNDAVAAIKAHDDKVERRIHDIQDATVPLRRRGEK